MTDKIEQPLFFPEPMLEHMEREAARLDRSLSWCAQKAWAIAGDRVARIDPGREDDAAEAVYGRLCPEPCGKRKQTLFFPEEMLQQIVAESARQDRSVSWLVQRAYCLAVDEIEGLPTSR